MQIFFFSEFSSFIFKVPVEKVVTDEEELHGIDVGELTRNIAKKKKPDVLQAYKCPLCDICYRKEHFFNKHVKYSESVR